MENRGMRISKAIEEIKDWLTTFLENGHCEYYFPNDPKIDEPGVRRIIDIMSDENGNLNLDFQRRLYMEKPGSTYIPVSKHFVKVVDSVLTKDCIEQAEMFSQLLLSSFLVLDSGGLIYREHSDSDNSSPEQERIKNNKNNNLAANQVLAIFDSMTKLDSESENELIGLLTASEPNIEKLTDFFVARAKPFDLNNSSLVESFFLPDNLETMLQRFVNHCFYLIDNKGADQGYSSQHV